MHVCTCTHMYMHTFYNGKLTVHHKLEPHKQDNTLDVIYNIHVLSLIICLKLHPPVPVPLLCPGS